MWLDEHLSTFEVGLSFWTRVIQGQCSIPSSDSVKLHDESSLHMGKNQSWDTQNVMTLVEMACAYFKIEFDIVVKTFDSGGMVS